MSKPGFEIKFCPHCAQKLVERRLKDHEPERLVCPGCGYIYYLDPKLAACAVVQKDGRVALVRRSIDPGYGLWVIPGGFVDRGEEVEEAVLREIKEETGLEALLGALLGLYSYPGETVVVAVYLASVRDGRLEARDEALEAAWFAEEEIPWSKLAFRSSRDALRDYFRRIKDAQTH